MLFQKDTQLSNVQNVKKYVKNASSEVNLAGGASITTQANNLHSVTYILNQQVA